MAGALECFVESLAGGLVYWDADGGVGGVVSDSGFWDSGLEVFFE